MKFNVEIAEEDGSVFEYIVDENGCRVALVYEDPIVLRDENYGFIDYEPGPLARSLLAALNAAEEGGIKCGTTVWW